MHLITQTDLSPTGVDSNARGKINVTMTRQGETSNQEVKISVVNLDPNTTYGLIARIGNTTVATGVTQFTTDRKGAFSITYMENLQGKSGLHAVLLPVVLNAAGLAFRRELATAIPRQAEGKCVLRAGGGQEPRLCRLPPAARTIDAGGHGLSGYEKLCLRPVRNRRAIEVWRGDGRLFANRTGAAEKADASVVPPRCP